MRFSPQRNTVISAWSRFSSLQSPAKITMHTADDRPLRFSRGQCALRTHVMTGRRQRAPLRTVVRSWPLTLPSLLTGVFCTRSLPLVDQQSISEEPNIRLFQGRHLHSQL
ncbi:hypothetical protein EXIGLDRAFT_393307 [Exidia glandulosa HHB12029]|uniref:Uncharacterized protein n=1 Tax=Exidia glandulosa HHB12029 TaxID=1314781 RepID=A0A165BQQ4_EXIGL|nr:hypothetical protein EXIGLDRAFT_393307 [Exidia glandulosa HHB12029]